MRGKKLDKINVVFMAVTHLVAIYAVYYMVTHFHWQTAVLGLVWFALCGLAITAGYHRLFSHPTYKTNAFIRAFLLFFGAAGVQNSALKWSSDHRRHHAKVDQDEDPYNIKMGFWWAHIGWIFFTSIEKKEMLPMKDLRADKLVVFQERHYVLIAILSALVLPAAIGTLWGDPLGAMLVAGVLRLVVEWHATFAINSVAHYIGSRPYCLDNSARDSWLTAWITFGEGYHNFHHKFQNDYRNGIRWYHLDPTKWLVWLGSKTGLTYDLKRTSDEKIQRAKDEVSQATTSYQAS